VKTRIILRGVNTSKRRETRHSYEKNTHADDKYLKMN